MGIPFDPITHLLNETLSANVGVVSEQASTIRERVFGPIPSPPDRLSRTAAHELLLECAEVATSMLASICAPHSCDFWLTYVRRLPNVIHLQENVIAYSTIAILKWSDWSRDTTLGTAYSETESGEKTFHVVTASTFEDFVSFFKIATLSKVLDEIASAQRWISKGARLQSIVNGRLDLDKPPEVREAVESYEARRPRHSMFQDIGILASRETPSTTDYIIQLAHLPTNFERFELHLLRDGLKLFVPYCLTATAAAPIARVLQAYDEAIEEAFGAPPEAILQTLQALSRLVAHSIPKLDGPKGLSFTGTLQDPAFKHAFDFFFQLAQKGFLRFPEEYLRNQLSGVALGSYSHGRGSAEDLVSSFFDAFLFDPSNDELDILLLEPMPFLYRSPGDLCYVDLLAVGNFLEWIVRGAREWFTTQHGDRFTLALKRFLEYRTDVHFPRHQSFFSAGEDRAEVDLLVQKGRSLYAVECKAYAKSRKFWLGSPRAVASRSSKIGEAVKQARRAADVVKRSGEFTDVGEIEWVVCTPTQEFLNPVDRYGLLAEGVPRVCTPEEFSSFLGTNPRSAETGTTE